MFRLLAVLALALSLGAVPAPAGDADRPLVRFKTTAGDFEVELYPEKAPETVRNFLRYVETKYYNGTIFHRIEPELVQGGGYDFRLDPRETHDPIVNEAPAGLSNVRGTIAMAHGDDPHDADAEFFVNLEDNTALDHRSRTRAGFGYCAFGRVVAGLEVLDAMRDTETAMHPEFGATFPVEPVVILSARRVEFR